MPRGGFDVNLQLLMKLLGTSLATGLERVRLSQALVRIEERNALAELAANDGLWDFDVEGNDVYFSPRWRAMLGYDEADLKGGFDWRSLVHPDDMSRVQAAIREHVAGKTPIFESVHRMRHRNGEWRWVISRAKAQLDAHGRLLRLVGVELDITERKMYEEALFREKESAQITLQSIGDGVITTDAASTIDYINPVAEQLTGWRLEDAMGRPVEEIFRAFHEETCEPLENPLSVSIRRSAPDQVGAADAADPARRQRALRREHRGPDPPGNGKVGGGVLVFHDVSESRELNRRLSYHASHDLLTGLVNRREFEDRLERALKSAKAREASYALCYLDIDQFKIVNDTCGHSAGDALLGQVGALLKSKVRWRDTLSRLGGDEFGILLESCTLDEAMRMAESLREAVRNFRFSWEERVFRLGASIGVVPITADNEDVASILSAADSACAAAKEQGRNRVHSFAENDIELMRRRREMQWAARINAALEEGRFELFRMPILPLQVPEAGAHYELLLRMRDENGRIVAPDSFIAAAERYGITPSIDRWVVENALRWLVSEADERERLAMCSINLSGQSLGDDKFLPYVIDQFHRSGLDATKICFEITETAAVASFSQANRFIQALKGARLQVRARRLRHRPVLVRLSEALPGGLPEDRRQLRARDPARSDRPRDGALDQRDRPPDRQADHRRICRERRDHPDAQEHRRRLRAGLWRRPAAARAQVRGQQLAIPAAHRATAARLRPRRRCRAAVRCHRPAARRRAATPPPGTRSVHPRAASPRPRESCVHR